MQLRISFLFLLICSLACHNTNEEKSERATKTESMDSITKTAYVFDKTKWSFKEGKDYPYRDEMLKNAMNTQDLKSLKKDAVFDLLGQPDRIDSNYLFYMIAQKRLGFWPLHTKTMVIKFSVDTIEWIKIHE